MLSKTKYKLKKLLGYVLKHISDNYPKIILLLFIVAATLGFIVTGRPAGLIVGCLILIASVAGLTMGLGILWVLSISYLSLISDERPKDKSDSAVVMVIFLFPLFCFLNLKDTLIFNYPTTTLSIYQLIN